MSLQPTERNDNHIKYFLSILVLISSTSFFSCWNNSSKFYYLKCDSTIVNSWIDSVSNDSAHRIGRLILQFYSPDIKHTNNNMGAIIYPLNEAGDYYKIYPDSLTKGKDTSLTGPVVFGNNVITKQQIIDAITDTAGNRISYGFLLFKPIIDSNHHMRYAIYPANGSGPLNFYKTAPVSDPCPPAKCYY